MFNILNTMGAIFVEIVVRFVNRCQWFLANLNISAYRWPLVIIDVLLVAIIIYWLYVLFRDTKAMYILYGFLILGLIYLLAEILRLETILWLIHKFFTFFIIAILIIFQPELRKVLERLGRARFWGEFKKVRKTHLEEIVDKITKAIEILSSQKIGALMVIKGKDNLSEYFTQGVILDARLSIELLLNIFHPGAPLHDGAVIIDGDRILAAAVTLPLVEGELTYTLGTRHRAAIGLSSETDALVIVVSEERGIISIARNGKLYENLTSEDLKKNIYTFLKGGEL